MQSINPREHRRPPDLLPPHRSFLFRYVLALLLHRVISSLSLLCSSCASFASTTASTIFALYAALAALNLLLKTICDVKDACTDYLTLPKKVMGQNVSNPVCDTVQKHILDPIKAWRNPVFLDDLVGKPTVSDAATTLAGAMSGCMYVERPPPAPRSRARVCRLHP